MNIVTTSVRGTATPERGSDLKFSVACNHCGHESPLAQSEQAAIGLSIGAGWNVRIPNGYKLDGFFSVAHLENCDAICPRCWTSEFSDIEP